MQRRHGFYLSKTSSVRFKQTYTAVNKLILNDL